MLLESGPMLAIFKKNSDGMYLRFAGKLLQDLSCSISTNGYWFALSQGNSFAIFSLDEAGNFIQETQISESAHIHKLFVASDNTITVFRGNELVTYQINTNSSIWEAIATPVNAAISLCGYLTDTTFAGVDVYRGIVTLYTRQADGSWSNFDSFTYDPSAIRDISAIAWTGNTVILTKLVPCSMYGVTYVFTRDNGHWIRVMTGGASEINLPPGTRLTKADVLMIDETTAYVSVLAPAPRPPSEPDDLPHPSHRRNVQRETSPPVIGSVFLLRKVNAEWTYQAKIVPPLEQTMEFGAAIVETADNHLFYGCELQMNTPPACGFFSLGPCYADPVEITCEDVIIQNCSSLTSDINIDLLYTLNNPQCGKPLGVMYSAISVTERTQEYSFFLYKPFSHDVASCNMTATCPVPIISVQSAPIAAPSTAPAAIATPTEESEMVSSASKIAAAVSLELATSIVFSLF